MWSGESQDLRAKDKKSEDSQQPRPPFSEKKQQQTNNSENNFNRTIKRLFYPTLPLEFVNRPEKGNQKSTSNIQKSAKFSQSNETIHVLTSLQYRVKASSLTLCYQG